MGPTTGLPLLEARKFFLQTVISAISYGCPVWYIAEGEGKLIEKHQNFLRVSQNRFLRIIEGAYRSTKVAFLEHELCVYSLDLELYRRSMLFLAKLRTSYAWRTILNARNAILGQDHRDLLNSRPDAFAEKEDLLNHIFQSCTPDTEARWKKVQESLDPASNPDLQTLYKKVLVAAASSYINKEAKDAMIRRWTTEREYYTTLEHPPSTALNGWDERLLSMHAGLTRVQSIALIRLRTEVLRLRSYLFKLSDKASLIHSALVDQTDSLARTRSSTPVCPLHSAGAVAASKPFSTFLLNARS
jgi:hypothetical protein